MLLNNKLTSIHLYEVISSDIIVDIINLCFSPIGNFYF
jgi:hypothetical protein